MKSHFSKSVVVEIFGGIYFAKPTIRFCYCLVMSNNDGSTWLISSNSSVLNEFIQTQLLGLYEVVPLEDELASVCLCVTAKYNFDDGAELAKDIYFFGDGTVVFWNIPGNEFAPFYQILV